MQMMNSQSNLQNPTISQEKQEQQGLVQSNIITEARNLVSGKTEQQRFAIARDYLFNSLNFKTPRFDTEHPNASKMLKIIYEIQTFYMWRSFLLLIGYLFMYASFFGHAHPSFTLIGIQYGMLFILFLDLFFQIFHKIKNKLRPISRFQSRFYIKLFSLVLLLVDQIIVTCRQDLPIRPFLILRCVLPVIYDPHMRKMFYALLTSYKDILVYLIFYTIIIILFGIMANQFIQFPPNYQYDNFTGNYPDLGKSIFLMYVMTTFDAYPDNQLVAIRLNIWIYAFFIVFIFINALLFLTIPTNILLDSIKQTRSKTIIIDQIEQQHSLIMAFIALGGDTKRSIPYEQIISFLLYVFNNQAKYLHKITQICRNLDQKVNGNIQCIQFMQICKIIQSRSYLYPPRHQLWKRFSFFLVMIQKKFRLKQIIVSNRFQLVISVFIFLAFVNCILTLYINSLVFDVIDDVVMVLILIENTFKLLGLGPEVFFSSYLNIIDLGVALVSLFFELTPRSLTPRNAAVFVKMFRIFRVTMLIRYLSKCFSISFKSEIYQKLVLLINQIALLFPIIVKFFPLYMISYYFLGVVGVQVFWYQTDIKPEDSPYSAYRQFSNFNTLLGSQFIFVQVLTQAGWSLIAYDHAYRYGYFALTMLFFVISHEIIVIILTSLFKGIAWQCYNTISKAQNQYMQNKQKKEIEQASIKKKTQIIEAVREKIQNQKIIQPDNIISRELCEKKIDLMILQKMKKAQGLRSTFFSKKQKEREVNSPGLKPYKQSSSPLLVLKSKKSKQNLEYGFENQVNLQSVNPLKKSPSIKIMESPFEDIQESFGNVSARNEQDIQKEIDKLLDQVILDEKLKVKVKIQYPPCFIDFLKQKLKPLRTTNFQQHQFNVDKDIFATSDSTNILAHGLHTLLDIKTSQRQQRSMIVQAMIQKGIITHEKAVILLSEKSDFQDEFAFDFNWVIRQSYLGGYDERDIRAFETAYFSAIYGKSFKEINKNTIEALMSVEAKICYSLSNLMRYREMDSFQFFSTLIILENQISVNLLKAGSICKFIYQIDTLSETWFSIQLKQSNELRIHFIKNGIWIYHRDLNKQQIYNAKDLFNWNSFKDRTDQQECSKYLKRFYQTFEGLSLCIQDESFFNPKPENQIYNLYTFYSNVDKSPRYIKRTFSISKIMLVLLQKEGQRIEKVPYPLTDMKYSAQQIQEYKSKHKKTFRLDQTEDQTFKMLKRLEKQADFGQFKEGLPYAYLNNFLMHIRQIISCELSKKNFIFQIEKALNQYFKDSQAKVETKNKLKKKII